MSNETQVIELPEDIFKREAIAQSMCELICSAPAEAISPVVLQGPWGAGKSTHAMRMMKYLNENHAKTHKCIYWNASIFDYAADPLPLFVANLYSETDAKEHEQFTKAGFKLCSAMAIAATKELANQIIHIGSGLDLKGISEATSKAQEKAENPTLQQFKDFLQAAGTDRLRIDTAKELLDLARGDKELIVIIDELDRCRPGFALQMLETIKHLFTSKDCKFILIMNKHSLIDSICSTHGLRENNAETYLNKFIKATLQLPEIALEHRNTRDYNCQYFFHLLHNNYNFTEPMGLPDLILAIIKKKKLQLREIESWVRTITHLLKLNNIDSLENISNASLYIIVIISYLISFDTDTAFQLAEKSISTHELFERLGLKTCDLRIFTSPSMKYIELQQVIDYYLAQGTNKEDSFFKNEDDWFLMSHISSTAKFLKQWIQYSLFIRSI